MAFALGQTVKVRDARCVVVDAAPSTADPQLVRLTLRALDGANAGDVFAVIHPIDDVTDEPLPELSLDRIAPLRRFRLLHDAFTLDLAADPGALVAVPQARISPERYQEVPARHALALPRPRLLIADDVGLGKTIEAGMVFQELAQRHRARRVLVVAPAGICDQWRRELLEKFGVEFEIFDRDAVEAWRRRYEIGSNPWQLRPRIIASLDFAKLDGAFRELSGTTWDLAIVDEAHHVADSNDDEKTLNRRFAEWLSRNTDALLLLSATPHDGSDRGFASLLQLLEPQAAPPGLPLERSRYERYVVRRLKGHVRRSDGAPIFQPRAPVGAIPVELSLGERTLHEAVVARVKELTDEARRADSPIERTMFQFLGTIMRKRAASSRAALRETLKTRRETLQQDLSELDVRRDLLRKARAEESLTDEEQRTLERDLHARSVRSAQQRAGRKAGQLARELGAYEEIESILDELQAEPESKVSALQAFLESVWREDPTENVLVFSEYADTVIALAGNGPVGALRAAFGDRVLLLHGEIEDRGTVLKAFDRGHGLVLVTTDVASEGLNLQHRCRTLIHVDLPWNPNRLEQRNGRIDRYGQPRTPRIAYLYAKDTYDGELLNLLVQKVERQIRALGSVGDVLGAFQQSRLERLLEDVPADGAGAARAQEAELERIVSASPPEALAACSPEIDVVDGVPAPAPDLGEFVRGAIVAQGGEASIVSRRLEIARLPAGWPLKDPHSTYALPGSDDMDLPLLSASSERARAAIRSVRESRFDTHDDARVAAQTTSAVSAPTLVATYLLELRMGDGGRIERVAAFAEERRGSCEGGEELLHVPSAEAERPTHEIRAEFTPWWECARERAGERACRAAEAWAHELADRRLSERDTLSREVETWLAASRAAVSSADTGVQLALSLESRELSSAARRKLAALEQEAEKRRKVIADRCVISVTNATPLGVLLLMPERQP